jgi:hypothetical protein
LPIRDLVNSNFFWRCLMWASAFDIHGSSNIIFLKLSNQRHSMHWLKSILMTRLKVMELWDCKKTKLTKIVHVSKINWKASRPLSRIQMKNHLLSIPIQALIISLFCLFLFMLKGIHYITSILRNKWHILVNCFLCK